MSQVAIILCTYQGENYLTAQLQSILDQSHSDWKLFISDDGSKDQTQTIIKSIKPFFKKGSISHWRGSHEGFAKHFIKTTFRIEKKSPYYAWCDQDDIWHKDKLKVALAWLKTQPKTKPALYCGRTYLINEQDKVIGTSPLFLKPKTFQNALVQNIAGGNTMVFNEAARQLLLPFKNKPMVVHDWLLYLLVSGVGGAIHYDQKPYVFYRQHHQNLIGHQQGIRAKLSRLSRLVKGDFKEWFSAHNELIKIIEPQLTPRNKKTWHLFNALKNKSFLERLILLRRSKIYRQSFLGHLGLYLAACFNKL
jgi:glycosyltransferase involved in cell wall biosynthesis